MANSINKSVYFDQLNNFHAYIHSDVCTLSSGAKYLYFFLLNEWNDIRISRAPVFQLFESDIERYASLSKSSIKRRRTELIKHGLIAYVPGVKCGAGYYQFADLSDFNNLKPFEIAREDLPKRQKKKIPVQNEPEFEEIPGQNEPESEKYRVKMNRNSKIPGQNEPESEKNPVNLTGNNEILGQNEPVSDSLLYRDREIIMRDSTIRDLNSRDYLFSEIESRNEKIGYSFFDAVKYLWESRVNQYPENKIKKITQIHDQLKDLASKYGEQKVIDTVDYITSIPWVRGEAPDENGEFYEAYPEVVLCDDNDVWMRGLDRKL